jgi:hypothetical protein
MMDYLRAWIRNLFTDLLVIAVVCVAILIFMKIFYPDALSFLFLTGQAGVQLASALKLWPLIILIALVQALPRRKRRQHK